VSRDLVVTAAHCVVDPETKGLMSGPFIFYPGYTDHQGDVSSPVTYVWLGTNDPSTYRGADWAILRLRDPLGNSTVWMGVRAVDLTEHLNSDRFYAAGYSSDFLNGDSASWEKGCAFTAFNSNRRFFLHNCDGSRGSSGGPIFDYDDVNQPGVSNHIVALQVAEHRNGGEESLLNVPYSESTANVAVPASAFMHTLRQILDAQE